MVSCDIGLLPATTQSRDFLNIKVIKGALFTNTVLVPSIQT